MTGAAAMAKKRILFLLLALAAGGAQADAFKCRTADGGLVFSSTPCQGGSETMAVQPGEKITPEQRRAAEQEVERQRRILAEREAQRGTGENEDADARRRPIEGESSRHAQCIQDARQEPDSEARAELIAACNGISLQRPTQQPLIVQQPVIVPAVQIQAGHRSGLPTQPAAPKPQSAQPSPAPSACRQVDGHLKCY